MSTPKFQIGETVSIIPSQEVRELVFWDMKTMEGRFVVKKGPYPSISGKETCYDLSPVDPDPWEADLQTVYDYMVSPVFEVGDIVKMTDIDEVEAITLWGRSILEGEFEVVDVESAAFSFLAPVDKSLDVPVQFLPNKQIEKVRENDGMEDEEDTSTAHPLLPPQTERVLSILKIKGSLTAVEAQATAKVRSLSSRISELKKAGYDILSETCKDPVDGQRYVRYHLHRAA